MKAILVIDYASEEDIGKETSIRLTNEENEWTEIVVIKPMPEKKELVKYLPLCDDCLQQTRFMDYVNGYNACLEEIENG